MHNQTFKTSAQSVDPLYPEVKFDQKFKLRMNLVMDNPNKLSGPKPKATPIELVDANTSEVICVFQFHFGEII